MFDFFALDRAADHYASGYRALPTSLAARHYAEPLIRRHRIQDAEKLLVNLPADSAGAQGVLGEMEFARTLRIRRGALRRRTEILPALGAARDTSAGFVLLSALAEGKAATSDVFEWLACYYLSGEPVALRNVKRAEALARRAAAITGGQVSPFGHSRPRNRPRRDVERATRAAWATG